MQSASRLPCLSSLISHTAYVVACVPPGNILYTTLKSSLIISIMLDHVVISVPKDRFEEVVDWYLAALAPIGYKKFKDFPGVAVGLGPEKNVTPFWIGASAKEQEIAATHVAFKGDRAAVDQFHNEGIKAGGKCNGKPGLRHQYHAKYYAAFVYDPVGYVDVGGGSFEAHADFT